VVALVERQAADDAQARAVLAVERGDRLGELDRLADRPLEVELVVIGQADDVRPRPRASSRTARRSGGRSTGRASSRSRRERDDDVAQAAGALRRRASSDVGVDEEAAVRPGEMDAARDRRGERSPRRGRSSTPSKA
jgi:hypothetical protein